MKRKKVILLMLGAVLLVGAFLIGCPVGDDHPDVGRRAVVTFDTGDINPRTGERVHMHAPASSSVNTLIGNVIETFPVHYWRQSPVIMHRFNGWYTSPDGLTGVRIEEPFEVTGDVTFYAWWGDHEVVFDASGGSVSGESVVTIPMRRPPFEMADLPFPSHGSNAFLGWRTEDNGLGTLITPASLVTAIPAVGDVRTLYADWHTGPTTFTVTFDGNGGRWEGSPTIQRVIDAPLYRTLGEADLWPENPNLLNFPHIGWFTDEGVRFTSDSYVTGDITLTARWVYSAVDYIVFQLDSSDRLIGTLFNGDSIEITIPDAAGYSIEMVNGRRTIQFPSIPNNNLPYLGIQFGQLLGSFLAEDQWTIELFAQYGSFVSNQRVISAFALGGSGSPGTLWLERRGLGLLRPEAGGHQRINVRDGEIESGTFYHLAMVRNGNTWFGYGNGVRTGSADNPNLGHAAFQNVNNFFIRLNAGNFYKMVVSNRAKHAEDFAADNVMAIINALNE